MRAPAVTLLLISFIFVPTVSAAEWHNSFGVGVIDVNEDLEDIHRSNLQYEAKTETDVTAAMDSSYFYQPYYLYENGFAVGLGVSLSSAIIADEIFINMPLHVDVRYFFSLQSEFNAYVRAGVRYNLAFGEYVEGSKPGSIAGIGLLYQWNDNVQIGFEFIKDSSEIEYRDLANNRTESINLNQSIFSLVFVF